MFTLIVDVISPIFLLLALGACLTKCNYISATSIDGVMRFVQDVAVPALLFLNIARLDLGQAYGSPLLLAFYVPAFICFSVGTLGARWFYGRRPGEAVAVGFAGLFSNTVFLGLAISERAYGQAGLAFNYAIISIHTPFCYLLGILTMEFARADGRDISATLRVVFRTLFKNNLVIAILLGFAANLSGISLPTSVESALGLLAETALPVGVFGIGGVLMRYRWWVNLSEVSMVVAISLFLHPLLAYGLCQQFDLSVDATRAVVVTAASAPGVNAYLFANMYQRAQGTAASSVLLGTVFCALSATFWLWVLA